MPRFSVIVPAYKVQAYLHECLESVLPQSYAGPDRPIVVHAEDWAVHEAARGTSFDVRAFPPGAVARSEDELIDIFATGHWRCSRSAQLRAAFRERFCPYGDGGAAERVVRRVVLDETDVPLAERRPVPSASATRPRPAPATVPQPSGPRVTSRRGARVTPCRNRA